VAASDVLDLLGGLVRKSLVQLDESIEQPRYRVLETLRQYALERLAESGEEHALRQQHADYFLTLVAQTDAWRPGADRDTWIAHVQREHDNLRAALRWLLDSDAGAHALQLAQLLQPFWQTSCYYAEGQRWLEEALARSREAPDLLRGRGFFAAAVLATWRGAFAEATALGEEGLQHLRAVGDSRVLRGSLVMLALAASQQGDFTTARRLIEEHEALCRALDDKGGLGVALQLYSEVAINQGEFERAVLLAEESIALTRAHGPRAFLIHSLDNLARALLCCGEVGRAIPLWAEGLQLAWEWRDKQGLAYYLEGFAYAAAYQGQLERAALLAGAAHALRQEIKSPLSPSEAVIAERFLAPVRAQLDAATWQAAWTQGGALTLEQAMDYALAEEAAHARR
jgi:hypothetical protein